MVHLGKRLQCIHDLVEKDSIVADIGCDHALLSIALIESGTADKCYACDVAVGPLQRAKEAVSAAGLSDKIDVVLNDGIYGLPSDITTIVIAGMGFETIRHILLEGESMWNDARSFVLASHTDIEELRRFLSRHSFVIDDEKIVQERHFYQIIKAHHESDASLLSEDEIMFGVHAYKDPLFLPYWRREKRVCEQILSTMPLTHERRGEMEQRLARIDTMLQG